MPAPRTIVLLAAIATSGCQGGRFVVPSRAADALTGTITDDRYTAADSSFSVAMPYVTGSDERRHLRAKERTTAANCYLSFGPSGFDRAIYRLQIVRRAEREQRVDLRGGLDSLVAGYRDQLRVAYGTELEPDGQARDIRMDGRPARHTRFTQRAPAGTLSSDADVVLRHEVWAIEFPAGVACAWVQTVDGSPPAGIAADDFASSIELH